MSRGSPWRLSDVLAAHIVLASAAVELLVRETYHRVSAEATGVVQVAVGWMVVLILTLQGRRVNRDVVRLRLRRSAFMLATAVAFYILAGPGMAALLSRRSALVQHVATASILGGFLVCVAWTWRMADSPWTRLYRAVALACVVFMGSPIAFSGLQAPRVAWPSGRADEAASHPRTATLFLLLDELNAKSAEPFLEVMRARGLQARMKAVPTVGDSTAKVVPEMFSGMRFEQAKPCSPSAICSSSNVFDFGRVVATGSDVDVVGFFHPYCAMQGLRFCERKTVSSALLQPDRWTCALRKRLGLQGGPWSSRCSAVHGRVWSELARDVVEALWRAPVWREGGFLLAHLPLPHPPGTDPEGSLQAHYHDNVGRAARLVDEMLRRLRDAGIEAQVVIFSDHPLRQQLWCDSYVPYRANGCALDEAYRDEEVPVIVGGREIPSLDGVITNAQVFSLAASWR